MLHGGSGRINGVPSQPEFRFVLPVDVVLALTYFPVKNMFHRVPCNPFQAFYSSAVFWRRDRHQYEKDEEAFHSMIVTRGLKSNGISVPSPGTSEIFQIPMSCRTTCILRLPLMKVNQGFTC